MDVNTTTTTMLTLKSIAIAPVWSLFFSDHLLAVVLIMIVYDFGRHLVLCRFPSAFSPRVSLRSVVGGGLVRRRS